MVGATCTVPTATGIQAVFGCAQPPRWIAELAGTFCGEVTVVCEEVNANLGGSVTSGEVSGRFLVQWTLS